MVILLVEQFFEFARDLVDQLAVLDRGEIVLSGQGKTMEEVSVRCLYDCITLSIERN